MGAGAIAAVGGLALAACTAAVETPASIPIAGTRVFPESITADNLGTLYVGSNGGTIYRARSGDRQAAPWVVPSAANGLQSVFGVLADDARGMLWVCSNPPQGGSGAATLKALDLTTGAVRASYPFPAGPALCNDIAVAPGGRVYATDTIGGRIVTLPVGGTALETWAAAAEMRGIDGIAVGGDGTIYVNNVQQNLLQRVDLAEGGAFARLTTLTTPLPLSGPDGFRSIGGNRFLLAEGPGGRVSVLTIEGDRAELMPLTTGIDYPASMALVGRTVYVPEGKIGYLFDAAKRAQDPGPFTIHAIALPGEE